MWVAVKWNVSVWCVAAVAISIGGMALMMGGVSFYCLSANQVDDKVDLFVLLFGSTTLVLKYIYCYTIFAERSKNLSQKGCCKSSLNVFTPQFFTHFIAAQ